MSANDSTRRIGGNAYRSALFPRAALGYQNDEIEDFLLWLRMLNDIMVQELLCAIGAELTCGADQLQVESPDDRQ